MKSQSPNFKKFDILAIEPMNEKMMNQFCGGQLDCDILCLTMSARLEVDLKRANVALVSCAMFKMFTVITLSNSPFPEEFVWRSTMAKLS